MNNRTMLTAIVQRLDTMHYNLAQWKSIAEGDQRYYDGQIKAYSEVYYMLTGKVYEYEELR